MLQNVAVNLQTLISEINLPTVIKTTTFPGAANESIFIATQPGEIFQVNNGYIEKFLDISSEVLTNNGYDERGLLGLAFHPGFPYNGLFYLHYSVAGTEGAGAPYSSFTPNPCNMVNLTWDNREIYYNHIDTVEEWGLQANGEPIKRRKLLNIRRPFLNHNGVNSLNFSKETGRLVLTTGDGGSGYDPFNLSQNDLEIAGKIIEIDVGIPTGITNPPVVTRFNELPQLVQQTLTVTAKGIRNITGIAYQKLNNKYLKVIANVGQDLVESIFAYVYDKHVPVTEIVQNADISLLNQEEFINFGWRGWEGNIPTAIIGECAPTIAYYYDAINTSLKRINPLTCYYHYDLRPNKFSGNALTGVQVYLGNKIPGLTGSVVFTDLFRTENSEKPKKGVLAYTRLRTDCKLSDYSVINVNDNFGNNPAFYVSLGTNLNQTRLFLGVYGSMNVGDRNLGAVYEINP
jgi:hypothetical protein